ncbi:MAG: glycosyltransferase [Planctomycetota bacterium]
MISASSAATVGLGHLPTSRIERHDFGPASETPTVSVVVPTLDRHRRGLLDRLLLDLRSQTLARFEVLLVIGDRRQGRAINRGVREARAEIVVTMDDDTEVRTPRLLENLVDTLNSDPSLGLVGASTVVSEGASWFQRAACHQVPRRFFPIVDRVTDSDMVQHPCLALRRETFLAIGGEDEQLIRGLDPLLRHKVRSAGLRVVIAPNSPISHPLPDRFVDVLRMYYRNGRGSAFAQKHFPERIYSLSDGYCGNQFRERVPFLRRVASYPWRIARSILTLQWIRLGTELAYGTGFLVEYWGRSRTPTE